MNHVSEKISVRYSDGPDVELWEAFRPNPHQFVLGLLRDQRVVRVIWIDLGPGDELLKMPTHFRTVKFNPGHLNAMVELEAADGSEHCFSTSEDAKGVRALAIGNYFDDKGWDLLKLRKSTAKDVFTMVQEAHD